MLPDFQLRRLTLRRRVLRIADRVVLKPSRAVNAFSGFTEIDRGFVEFGEYIGILLPTSPERGCGDAVRMLRENFFT